MKDLQTHEVRAIRDCVDTAMDMLMRIRKESDQMYQSRRYMLEKAKDAEINIKSILSVLAGDDE